MIELEVKLGSKTGLETVQNGEHAVVEVAPYDGSIQAPLVRVTVCVCLLEEMYCWLNVSCHIK